MTLPSFWTCPDDRWKDLDDMVVFSIYTPVFTLSLAGEKKRRSCALSTPVAIRCGILIRENS